VDATRNTNATYTMLRNRLQLYSGMNSWVLRILSLGPTALAYENYEFWVTLA